MDEEVPSITSSKFLPVLPFLILRTLLDILVTIPLSVWKLDYPFWKHPL